MTRTKDSLPNGPILKPDEVSKLVAIMGSFRQRLSVVPAHTKVVSQLALNERAVAARRNAPLSLEAIERAVTVPNPDRQTITELLHRLRMDLEEFDRLAAKSLWAWMQANGRRYIR
jgi:hypothetical protein